MKQRSVYQFFVVTLLMFSLVGCHLIQYNRPIIIRLKGSDTMQLIARAWAADYMRRHPGISVYVEGGGTATGFKALINGKIDIALASRLIRSLEAQELSKRYGKIGLSFLTAKDALSIYLNPENPISNLNLEQLRQIFTGQIKNWRDVGGIDTTILAVIRPPTSGTYYYLKEHLLHDSAYSSSAVIIPTTAGIANFVATHINAIGYGGLAYGQNVKHCRINNVAATEEEVRKDRYPLTRYLYLYTVDKPEGAIKNFIDYTLSTDGQNIVAEVGYIPIWPTKNKY